MLRRHSTHTLDHEPGVDPVVRPAETAWAEDRRDVVADRELVSRPLPPPAPGPVPVLPSEDRAAYDTMVSRQRFSLASLLGGVAGIGLLVVGVVALLRGGLSGPIDDPVVQVLGFGHTPLLGLIDVGMGVLLLAAAAASSRGALTFLGLIAVVAGAVAVAEPGELADRLAVERSFGWIWLIGGGFVALAAWLLPAYERETRRVHRSERAV